MAGETNRFILDSNSFGDVVKMIIRNFLKMMKLRKSSMKSGCLAIDVQLVAKRDNYMAEITHYGNWTEKGVENLFYEFFAIVKKGFIPGNAVVAHVFQRADGEEDETVYAIFMDSKNLVKTKMIKDNKFVHLPSFKNYILIKLQYKLLRQDLSEFKKILLLEFEELKKLHRAVKIRFCSENDVFYSNNVASDEDFKNCQLLSLPLIAVVKQSMNNHFKERCLQTLGVDNVHHAQKDLTRKLFSMIHENYMIP